MSVDLEAIHRALAAQIRANVAEDTNVYPFPMAGRMPPCITVYPAAGTYLDYWKTFGPNGDADMMVRLKVEVDAAEGESSGIKMCRYLGVGVGNTSSVIDAVMADRTLGGTVDSAVILTAEWADPDTDPGVAWFDVSIILSKQNAEA